jgi:hypothetical protein
VRPAAVELLDELDELDVLEDVDDEVLLEPVEVLDPGSPPDPPQAVRARATASPTAYVIGPRGVIFVTNPSLDSGF